MNKIPFKPDAKHTPGPWQAICDPCPTTKNRWLVEKRSDGWKSLIALVYADKDHTGGEQWQGSREDNARLIALAPELVETLRECVTEPGACCFARDRKDFLKKRLNYITEIAQAVLAKLEGASK